MSQSTGVSRVSGQFAFEVQGLCMTRDMLSECLGPVSRGEGVSVSVWLPQAMSNAEKFLDGRDLVEVDGFIVQVDVLQSPPVTLPGQAAGWTPRTGRQPGCRASWRRLPRKRPGIS